MQNFLGFVARLYAFVFHLTLGTFLVGLVALAAWSHQLSTLDMLPFDFEHLLRNTLLLGLTSIGCSLLALTRGFKIIFFLWTIFVVYLMLKWFYFGDYFSSDIHQSKRWLTIGAIAALFGAGWTLRTRRRMAIL